MKRARMGLVGEEVLPRPAFGPAGAQLLYPPGEEAFVLGVLVGVSRQGVQYLE